MTLKDLSVSKRSIATPKKSPLCRRHPEELLKLYCQDCEVLVCRDCVLVTHKTHNYSFVDDAIEDEKQQLKDCDICILRIVIINIVYAMYGCTSCSLNNKHVT